MSFGPIRQPGGAGEEAPYVATLANLPSVASQQALWLADDLSATGDGNPVPAWVDRTSGFSAANTSTARPTYRATGMGSNSRPSVQFDGTNDVLIYTASNPVSTSATGCIVAVANVTAPVSGGCAMWGSGDDGSSTRYIMGPVIAGPKMVAQADAGGGSADILTGPIAAGTPEIYEWESIGTESLKAIWRLRKNNSILTLTAQANSNNGRWFAAVTSRDRFGIGGLPYNNTQNNFLNGHLSFLLIADRELSATDRTALYAWLSSYYGITIP